MNKQFTRSSRHPKNHACDKFNFTPSLNKRTYSTDFPTFNLAVTPNKIMLSSLKQPEVKAFRKQATRQASSYLTESATSLYNDMLRKAKTILLPTITKNKFDKNHSTEDDTNISPADRISREQYIAEKLFMIEKKGSVEDLQKLGPSLGDFFKCIAKKNARERIRKSLNLPSNATQDNNLSKLRENLKQIQKKLQYVQTVSLEGFRQFSPLIEEVCKPGSRFSKKGQALCLFRKCSKIILIVLQWIKMIFKSNQYDIERELKTFKDFAAEYKCESYQLSVNETGLVFDKNHFKAKKEATLCHDVKRLLTIRGIYRTSDMMKQILHGLQGLQSVSDYPIETQEKLCRAAWYQTFGPKKVLIREGHVSEHFYLIISGSVSVNKVIIDPRTKNGKMQACATLSRGQAFGDLGLIFNSRRSATVESITDVELLVIGKSDYADIFAMSQSINGEPDHVHILRDNPITRHWPLENLELEPGSCMQHYFRRGSVITDDSKGSEWLFFIKSGSCDVLKKLKAVHPRRTWTSSGASLVLDNSLKSFNDKPFFPRIVTGRRRRDKHLEIKTDILDKMTTYFTHLREDLKNTSSNRLPDISWRCRWQSKDVECVNEGKTEEQEVHVLLPPVIGGKLGQSGKSKSKFSHDDHNISTNHFILPTHSMLQEQTVSMNDRMPILPTDKHDEIYVKVKVLQQKDAFGFDTLEFHGDELVYGHPQETASFCIVSQGSEIVMLSKRIFTKYADDKVIAVLRDSQRPYPMESIMQENLQTQMDWDLYKSDVLSNSIEKNRLTKSIV